MPGNLACGVLDRVNVTGFWRCYGCFTHILGALSFQSAPLSTTTISRTFAQGLCSKPQKTALPQHVSV